jgi:ABC-type Fe3+-hydroxamate transport system substrate-binding protein
VERLRAAGLEVWVTYPRSVREGAELLRELAGLGASPQAVAAQVEPVLAAVAAAEAQPPRRRARVFCPIWRNPWMSVGRDTYAHDLLALCGGQNVFAERSGRRYPIVTEAEIAEARPEVVLLPDEPYAFGAEDVRALAALGLPAARAGCIHRIDGTLLSWYGPRIRRALETLRPLLAGADDADAAEELA